MSRIWKSSFVVIQRTSTRIAKSARLRGQVALVTGATRGIGLALAHALAAEGCNLILTARNESALTRASREVKSRKMKILAHPCAVRDPHTVDALFRSMRTQFKRLDILINNAGIAHPNLPVEKLPYPVWEDVLATHPGGNLPHHVGKHVLETTRAGLFLSAQAALAIMKRGGSIVNNLSIAA